MPRLFAVAVCCFHSPQLVVFYLFVDFCTFGGCCSCIETSLTMLLCTSLVFLGIKLHFFAFLCSSFGPSTQASSDAFCAMALVPVSSLSSGAAPGMSADGSVLAATGVHPPLEGGNLLGHGGCALRLFVGLTETQHHQLDHMGRRNEFYWPLKVSAEAALRGGTQEEAPSPAALRAVRLRPVSVTFVGLRDMVANGTLYCCDSAQWRLYAPLRIPAPRDGAGEPYYFVHGAYTLG